ncbi:MAG TPA: hypothetical protein PKE00_04810 [Planctomycetota bacterium]|nr:hypothetical protein [Planctomycetota bacterium]
MWNTVMRERERLRAALGSTLRARRVRLRARRHDACRVSSATSAPAVAPPRPTQRA